MNNLYNVLNTRMMWTIFIIILWYYDDKIRDDILQYDINREAAKISTLLSGKVVKYE